MIKKKYNLILLLFLLPACLYAQEARNNIDFEAEEKKQHEEENAYRFSVDYRIEIGYTQPWQHSRTDSYRNLYLHGAKVGATFDFNLPYHLSIQTGLYYSASYGISEQHIRAVSSEPALPQILKHRILSHQLIVPVRATYTQKIWRQLALWLYTGPELSVGIAQKDYLETSLSEPTLQWCQNQGMHTAPYEIYSARELNRANIQWGLGGGLQWDKYRLLAGYNFGLNNLARQQTTLKQHMWEWSWYVSFSYRF